MQISRTIFGESPLTRFCVSFAVALHRAGTPAHRLEHAMASLSGAWNVDVRIFALPRALLVAMPDGRLHVVEAEPGDPALDTLDALQTLARDVGSGACSAPEGLDRLDAIARAPAPYGTMATLAGFALCGAAAAAVFGGGLHELLASTLSGWLAGFVAQAMVQPGRGTWTAGMGLPTERARVWPSAAPKPS